MTQRLIIRFDHEEGFEEVKYERDFVRSDESFWAWLMAIWPVLGLDFVKTELDK